MNALLWTLPGLDEAEGSYGTCNTTQTETHKRSEEDDDGPITVNTCGYVREKQHPDQPSRVSKHGCSKRETHQAREHEHKR